VLVEQTLDFENFNKQYLFMLSVGQPNLFSHFKMKNHMLDLNMEVSSLSLASI